MGISDSPPLRMVKWYNVRKGLAYISDTLLNKHELINHTIMFWSRSSYLARVSTDLWIAPPTPNIRWAELVSFSRERSILASVTLKGSEIHKKVLSNTTEAAPESREKSWTSYVDGSGYLPLPQFLPLQMGITRPPSQLSCESQGKSWMWSYSHERSKQTEPVAGS